MKPLYVVEWQDTKANWNFLTYGVITKDKPIIKDNKEEAINLRDKYRLLSQILRENENSEIFDPEFVAINYRVREYLPSTEIE